MSEKSHVGIGFHVCPVCGKEHDEVVLLDNRLKDSLKPRNFVGFELCPEDKEKSKDFMALIEVSNMPEHDTMQIQEANRTGKIAHVRRSVLPLLVNVEVPADQDMMFVQEGVIDELVAMVARDASVRQDEVKS